MATDVFMDMLTPTAQRPTQGYFGADNPALKGSRAPRLPVDTRGSKPAPVPADTPQSSRPDYADDIDRIVTEMVAAGFVVFDHETQTYRRPHVRRWRFA